MRGVVKMSELTFTEIQKLIEKHGGDQGVRKYLAKETASAPTSGMAYVNRTIPPDYPGWVKEVLYPELESTGPSEFDAGKLEQWLHEEQKRGRVTGNTIHQYLKDHDMLKNCLGLRDLEEMKKKGITFFRKHFKGKNVFGWKAVVRGRYGYLYVPYLYESGGVVYLGWYRLVCDWGSFCPALRLASA